MKLNDKVLRYFEVQRKKEKPTCTIFIDAHGTEELTKNCEYDTSIVYSLSGILGSGAYVYGNNDRSNSLYFMDIMRQHPPATTETLKEKAQTMATSLYPHVIEKFTLDGDHVDKWGHANKEYVLTPMKQMTKKKYWFLHDKNETERHLYNFGIYITDITYPPNTEPDEKLEQLRDVNIVSPSFLSSDFSSAVGYLTELMHNKENTILINKEGGLMDGTCIAVITFEEIINLLYNLGFEYSFIFDNSCRTHPAVNKTSPTLETKTAFKKLAVEERKLSLQKHDQKMKSAETRKKRPRNMTSLRSRSFKDSIGKNKKQEFYDKITEFVEGALTTFGEVSEGFTTTTEINKGEVVVSVYFGEYELFRIQIETNFLKIKSVVVEDVNFTNFKNMTEESEGTRAYNELKSHERKFKGAIHLMTGKTLRDI